MLLSHCSSAPLLSAGSRIFYSLTCTMLLLLLLLLSPLLLQDVRPFDTALQVVMAVIIHLELFVAIKAVRCRLVEGFGRVCCAHAVAGCCRREEARRGPV